VAKSNRGLMPYPATSDMVLEVMEYVGDDESVPTANYITPLDGMSCAKSACISTFNTPRLSTAYRIPAMRRRRGRQYHRQS
jgi:hypothetical protein